MTTAVIGLESMPNVYFNSVEISNDKLQILLSMKDFKEKSDMVQFVDFERCVKNKNYCCFLQ